VIELEVPVGLTVVHFGGTHGFGSNVTDVSQVSGGGVVPPGYKRIRLNKPASMEWMYLNVALPLQIEVDAALEGRDFPLAKIRAYTGAANQDRAGMHLLKNLSWQGVKRIRCENCIYPCLLLS
jgi:hypothetical protein